MMKCQFCGRKATEVAMAYEGGTILLCDSCAAAFDAGMQYGDAVIIPVRDYLAELDPVPTATIEA